MIVMASKNAKCVARKDGNKEAAIAIIRRHQKAQVTALVPAPPSPPLLLRLPLSRPQLGVGDDDDDGIAECMQVGFAQSKGWARDGAIPEIGN